MGDADWSSVAPYATNIRQNMSKLGFVSGKGGGILDPRGTATRAQAAQVLYNVLIMDAKLTKRERKEYAPNNLASSSVMTGCPAPFYISWLSIAFRNGYYRIPYWLVCILA